MGGSQKAWNEPSFLVDDGYKRKQFFELSNCCIADLLLESLCGIIALPSSDVVQDASRGTSCDSMSDPFSVSTSHCSFLTHNPFAVTGKTQ